MANILYVVNKDGNAVPMQAEWFTAQKDGTKTLLKIIVAELLVIIVGLGWIAAQIM